MTDHNKDERRHRPSRFAGLRASFLTGLVVIAPIFLTAWLIWNLVGWIDSWVLPFVPAELMPEQYIGINRCWCDHLPDLHRHRRLDGQGDFRTFPAAYGRTSC